MSLAKLKTNDSTCTDKIYLVKKFLKKYLNKRNILSLIYVLSFLLLLLSLYVFRKKKLIF